MKETTELMGIARPEGSREMDELVIASLVK